MSRTDLTAAAIRERLPHPVIDADGHWVELGPFVREELRRIGGDLAVEGYSLYPSRWENNLAMPLAERRRKRIAQGGWWTQPTKNTLDRATAMMPHLLYERMHELGFDFAVLYPTAGHRISQIPDARMRQATCRAFNTFCAEYFREFADRLTPAAVIPMHDPEEAIAELEYVVKELGLKVASLRSMIPRPAPANGGVPSGAAGEWIADFCGVPDGGVWYDVLGLDSAYDYDPVWEKCLELGISPTFHSGSNGIGTRASPTNFVFNHIGHFAAANEAVCRALFLGGVTRRFPRLKFGFLEGGVGWACQLLGDLAGHWERRNLKALDDVDPKNIDGALLLELAKKYGHSRLTAVLEKPAAALDTVMTAKATKFAADTVRDDFAACKIERKEEIRDLFADSFYFGCEADDCMNASAFNRRQNAFGARLNTLFGSDIGHFDVQDMAGVLPEAYELVQDELIGPADLRDFLFANPVRFYGEANPNFFKGTAVEAAAAELLK